TDAGGQHHAGQLVVQPDREIQRILAGVMLAASIGDHPPTASAMAVRDELVAAIDAQLARLDTVLDTQMDAFNALAAQLELPAVATD
ncbi:MAG: hypothetical protein P8Y52_14915, partial [Xanthomonadales bacterium]